MHSDDTEQRPVKTIKDQCSPSYRNQSIDLWRGTLVVNRLNNGGLTFAICF